VGYQGGPPGSNRGNTGGSGKSQSVDSYRVEKIVVYREN